MIIKDHLDHQTESRPDMNQSVFNSIFLATFSNGAFMPVIASEQPALMTEDQSRTGRPIARRAVCEIRELRAGTGKFT